ncbi:MAG: formylmethanofuran dehydrogenase subunit B [Planctomycetes bacterium]|nr:formylmethanofuran dehydrogenase subunit B [Planctomycetota bacterium]
MSDTVITDVACTVCACVCDDLTIRVRDGQIVGAERGCKLTDEWFRGAWKPTASAVQVRGEGVAFETGVQAAAEILRTAKAPLIYGLSKSSTEGQRAAVALADRLGAIIDTTASEGHAPSILAMQQSGESTCSLGEIRNRADLVIYWGCDPLKTHPRHLERYSMDPTGLMVPNGARDRSLIVIDSHPNETTARADAEFLQIREGSDFDALWALRGLLKGVDDSRNPDVGLPWNALRTLAHRMKSCRCGVIFFGYGVARAPLGHRNVEALLRLVIDLNQFTRFHARRLRVVGDVSGADSVLCWQTGYPFSVNLSRGFPRYNPGEYSAADVLENREADALVLVGSSRVNSFPEAARAHMESIPVILLEGVRADRPPVATVLFTTATYGIHRPGTAYRMDETPIRLRPVLEAELPTDGDVLRAIHAAL